MMGLAASIIVTLGFGLVGWVPLLEPMPMPFSYLVLMLPMIVAVSFAYKAIKVEEVGELPREGLMLSAQILIFMALAAVVLWALARYW